MKIPAAVGILDEVVPRWDEQIEQAMLAARRAKRLFILGLSDFPHWAVRIKNRHLGEVTRCVSHCAAGIE